MESSSCYIFDKTGVERRFVTLQDLLTHYKKHDPKEKGGLPARLEICLPYTK